MSNPTNEERREVAERLRNMTCRDCRYAEQFYELLKETVMNVWDFHEFDDVADRLADLIEPEPERTCRIEYVYAEGSAWPHAACSECGGSLSYYDTVNEYGEESMDPCPYCPNCGAKVVER